MLPFLASTIVINGSDASDTPAETVAHTATPAKEHHRNSDSSDTVFAAIPIVAIVFTFIYLITKTLMAPFTQKSRQTSAPPLGGSGFSEEEQALLGRIQHTLTQMESRVESLETILIEQTRSKEKYGTKL